MEARLFPLLLLAGCATVQPKFGQDASTHNARDAMRKLTTPLFEVYYPEAQSAAVRRLMGPLEDCASRLRRLEHRARQSRIKLFITSSTATDATSLPTIVPLLSDPEKMTLSLNFHRDRYTFWGFGVGDLAGIACHEAVHFITYEQTHGLWAAINSIFGEVLAPNAMTEEWFQEGLAVFYQSRLQGTGLVDNPFWRGQLEAGAQGAGHLDPTSLSTFDRRTHPTPAYLVGASFIQFLVQRYGEEKLWELMELQGDSIFSPIGVSLRFKSVYGKTEGGLFDEFSEHLASLPRRAPAPGQERLAPAGKDARLAVAPDGAFAVIGADVEQPLQLAVFEPDGRVRFRRNLVEILPGRALTARTVDAFSGLSFTADGRSIFALADALTEGGGSAAGVWEFSAANGEVVRHRDGLVGGIGGGVSPDGRRYVFVEQAADVSNLVVLDLSTGLRQPLTHFTSRESLAQPSFSPGGESVAFARRMEAGYDLFVLDAQGTQRRLTADGRFNLDPRWIDDHTLIFLRETGGRLQAHRLDLTTGALDAVTDAPHVVLDAAAAARGQTAAGSVVFLNRAGWRWFVERVSLPGPPPEAAGAPAPAPAPQALPVPTAPPGLTELSDERYHPTEGLAFPYLRLPAVMFIPGRGLFAGLSLQGDDALGFHRYAVNATYTMGDPDPSVWVRYGTSLTSPWFLQVAAGRFRDGARLEHSAALTASRRIWDTSVRFDFEGLDRLETPEGEAPAHARLVGPSVGLSYSAGESTPHGGLRRGFALSLSAGAFPRWLGSTGDVVDLHGELSGAFPGPLSNQSWQFTVRGQLAPGAPEPLVRLGGTADGLPIFLARDGMSDPATIYPAFDQPLRGYEDASVRVDRAAIADLRTTFPVIIDKGWTSVAYVLPAPFIRQLDLQLFGSAALSVTRGVQRWHPAFGGALSLHLALNRLPFVVGVQGAARPGTGLGPSALVTFALEPVF